MTDTGKHTPDDLLDLIETAISDSMDMDWTPRLGAEHVCRAMEREGVIARMISAHEMLEALVMALPYVETAELDEGYKPGVVAKVAKAMRAAIDSAEGRS